jgi:hypothetical protein
VSDKTPASTVRDAECIGGGQAYVGHGEDIILLAFTEEVCWWRNSVALSPDQARRLATRLTQQADATDKPESGASHG